MDVCVPLYIFTCGLLYSMCYIWYDHGSCYPSSSLSELRRWEVELSTMTAPMAVEDLALRMHPWQCYQLRQPAGSNVLHAWGHAFIQEVLSQTPWEARWDFSFQRLSSDDPWVIFHIGPQRSRTPADFEKCYHGCPLSIAQRILREGFRIGQEKGVWFCPHGGRGYGRHHAQDRSDWTRGHKEDGHLCLWSPAVVIAFAMPKKIIGKGGHEAVGIGTETEVSVLRVVKLPTMTRSLQPRDLLSLTADPFMPDSIELHVNLRHYGNYQYWDVYHMSCESVSGIWHRNRIDQLLKGTLILCCTQRKSPFQYSHVTCGAVVSFARALELGWQSSNERFFYCGHCAKHRLNPKVFESLTPDVVP